MKQETEFVNFPKCYESCGGYCCKGFKNANFKFFDGSYVALPLLENEFNMDQDLNAAGKSIHSETGLYNT